LIPLILDYRPPYLCGEDTSLSLLTMSLGRHTLLQHLVSDFGCDADQELVIITTFFPSSSYVSLITAGSANPLRIVEAARLADAMGRMEPQDTVCVLDPICRPLARIDLPRLWQDHRQYNGVIHAVAVGAGDDLVSEQVEHDGEGKVRRVQRLFGKVSMPAVASGATFASLMPASTIRNVSFSSLAELRARLAQKGFLGWDVPLGVNVADLNSEMDLLQLSEWVLLRESSRT
jgi:hypothetical protein